MTQVSNIARNTSYFTFALILQKVISFSYFIILARYLGPEDLGKYYFAIAFTSVFSVFVDLGFANITTREVARDQGAAQRFLSTVLALKIPLAAMVILIVVALTYFFNYSALTRLLIFISLASMALDSFSATFFSVMRGFHNLFFESIMSVLFQMVVFVFGIFFLWGGLSLPWLMLALFLASIFMFLYSLLVLMFKFKIKVIPDWNASAIKKIFLITCTFSLFAVSQKAYIYLDSVMLSLLANDYYTGIYQVPFKIINALQFLPMAFTASLYPAFALYWHKNREQLIVSFERAMRYLLIISAPIAAGSIAVADKLVNLLRADYAGAIAPLQIGMVALVFIFLIFPVGSLLNACDRQKINAYIMGTGLVLSVALNYFLILKWQAVGASMTMLVTNFLMFVLMLSVVPKIIACRWKSLSFDFLKITVPAVLMGVMAFYLKQYIHFIFVIAISGVFYCSMLFLSGSYKVEDIKSVMGSFKK